MNNITYIPGSLTMHAIHSKNHIHDRDVLVSNDRNIFEISCHPWLFLDDIWWISCNLERIDLVDIVNR